MERQLGRITMNKVLECRWRIFPSGKGSKVLRPQLDGRCLGGFREILRQWMVLDVHGEALMCVGHGRAVCCEGPGNVDLQVPVVLVSVGE